jgi:hypothetical protein
MIRDDMKFDVRTIKYRKRRNELTDQDVQKELDTLPDEAAEAEPTTTQFVATFEERNYNRQ